MLFSKNHTVGILSAQRLQIEKILFDGILREYERAQTLYTSEHVKIERNDLIVVQIDNTQSSEAVERLRLDILELVVG